MKSYPSITYIQKSLKMSRTKVISCINNLSQSHVILKKKYGKGLNSVYLLVNLSPIPNPKETLSGPKEVLPSPKQVLPSPKQVLEKDLVLKDSIKKTNKKEAKPVAIAPVVQIDLPFKTDALLDKWDEWTKYKSSTKKTLNIITKKKQIAKLAKFSEVEAVAMLETAMVNGWIGFFEPKKTNGAANSKTPGFHKKYLESRFGKTN